MEKKENAGFEFVIGCPWPVDRTEKWNFRLISEQKLYILIGLIYIYLDIERIIPVCIHQTSIGCFITTIVIITFSIYLLNTSSLLFELYILQIHVRYYTATMLW